MDVETAHQLEPLTEGCGARVRPLRADALRNRAILLDAARSVFQRDGLAAQMDAIAEVAGLGVGTLYRHFPTKEALIAVLVQEGADRLVRSAQAATRNEDAWEAVSSLVWSLATFEAEGRGMVDILTDQSAQIEGPDMAMTVLMESLRTVVARAQAAGQMRDDVTAQDVLVAVCGVGKMMGAVPDGGDGRWRRLVRVILDGLRTSAQSTGCE
jgi:AcrR family transcriptional regulator